MILSEAIPSFQLHNDFFLSFSMSQFMSIYKMSIKLLGYSNRLYAEIIIKIEDGNI